MSQEQREDNIEDNIPLIKTESRAAGSNGTESKTMTKSKHNQNELIRRIALVVLVIQGSMLAVSLRYSRMPMEGRTPYRTSVAVLCGECLKVFVATIAVFWTENDPVGFIYNELVTNWRTTVKVGIPALIYTIQNNLLYFALTELDATVYQVLYQGKLLTTAFFATLILKREFSRTRWFSLVVLAIGVILVNLSGLSSSTDDGDSSSSVHITVSGVTALLCAAVLSGLAGVWFEKMLKGSKVSLWMRNIQLGLFSIVFASFSVALEGEDENASVDRSIFVGFSPLVLFVIIQNACGGLLVAIVMKYADNILKGFATSISIILTSLICVFVPAFGFRPSLSFATGTTVVLSATYMYNIDSVNLFPGCELERSLIDMRGRFFGGSTSQRRSFVQENRPMV